MNIVKEIEKINYKLDFLVSINQGTEMTNLANLVSQINKAVTLTKAAGDKITSLANTSVVDSEIATLETQLQTALNELETVLNTANVTSNSVTLSTTPTVNAEVVLLQKAEGVVSSGAVNLGSAAHSVANVGLTLLKNLI